jgi:hypothetical protein
MYSIISLSTKYIHGIQKVQPKKTFLFMFTFFDTLLLLKKKVWKKVQKNIWKKHRKIYGKKIKKYGK